MSRQPIRRLDRLDVERGAVWNGNELVFRNRVVASIEPDVKYPAMWRVRLPSGQLSDMVNRTRAKDAAIGLAVTEFTRWRQRDDRVGARWCVQIRRPLCSTGGGRIHRHRAASRVTPHEHRRAANSWTKVETLLKAKGR
jgi:hypothetical protein